MNELARGAREVLNAMENDGVGELYIINFVKAVEQFALNSPMGEKPQVQAMEKVQQALNRLDQRMENIEKATAAATAAAPSKVSSSAGVSPAELREDCEIIVKIRDSDTRETLRRRTPREIVEQAERTRETAARRKMSAPLGGGCYFVAAKVLPSGDVKMTVNSASGAELLRTHVEWLKAFGPAAHVRKPTWGVVARGIDTKTMQLTPESMGGLAKELIRQNSHSWGGSRDNVEILHLGWLIKPGKRREGSIVIEFTDPVVANHAITQGTLWQHQVHQTTRFCREGRSKLCLKCQKPGHVHSQCLNEYQCGHCAKGHPTWECPKQGDAEIKCANCGAGHRPTSDACEVKAAAKEEARLALANSPLYHRVPLHFRQKEATKGNATTFQPQGANQGLNTSTHAPQQQVTQGTASNRINPKRIPVPAPSEIRRMDESVGTERGKKQALNRRKEAGPALRTRSRTSGDNDLPTIPESAITASQSARSLRSQNQALARFIPNPERRPQQQATHKKRRITEPADVMEEDQEWEQQAVNCDTAETETDTNLTILS
ncbi:Reverse transcriptase, putative [Penicillium digitatum]|uniref:Reverse transcriptase, putative n=1 Tax=Penicillium digitatum TaxID=36651 RepID=A0A7T6XU44_PENDI|nr:Reverse transcriptase, putative [Penicillium digitatum]